MALRIPQIQLIDIFKNTQALLDGHFLLTSGKHSSQYFQCAKVLQYPNHLHLLCGEIAKCFEHHEIEVVISPAIGGIVVGTEVGRIMGVRTIFAERAGGVMELRRGFELKPGERVLIVEDVITTGGSVTEIIALVQHAKANLVGVGSIVDRSNGSVKFEAKQFSVLQLDAVSYSPDECPQCAQGSKPVKPGSRGNY